MAELNFKKLADAPVLEEVPDGAKVYAEVDGKVYRVAGDNLGGGVKTAIIRMDMSSVDSVSLMTLAAGDGERASDVQEYPCTVENMTFEEAEAILSSEEPLNFIFSASEADGMLFLSSAFVFYQPGKIPKVSAGPSEAMIGVEFSMMNMLVQFTWTPSECVSTMG